MNQEKIDYIQNWLFRAREDIAVMNRLSDSDIDFPRTHDVDFLLMECQKIDDAISI